jgi:hypothetical protein
MKQISPDGRPEFTLPFGSWFNFVDEFYPPAKAAFMQLSFNNRKDSKLFISDIVLAPAPDEGAINSNPTFALGKYNYSGWPGRHTGGRMIERPDGKVIFDTGYGSGSESFPMSQAGTYRLYAKGVTYGGYSDIILSFLGEDGKAISVTHLNATPAGAQRDFIRPEGTVRGRLLIYNNILEELRLTRIGDENMATGAKDKK